ncbi:MAG TPA: transcription antitermination factor NusB [Burkholderiales bacterium]|nr:transcription antitermination factor NusB [Burkholderiales bacterium]
MKTSRRKSRELALQALYEWQLTANSTEAITEQLRQNKNFAAADENYFSALLTGATKDAQYLEQVIAPHLDRAFKSLSPIERGVLLLAGYELLRQPEVPYRVVINEAVELAKSYGGTDGYKYVNGVLDKLAADLRPAETQRQSR